MVMKNKRIGIETETTKFTDFSNKFFAWFIFPSWNDSVSFGIRTTPKALTMSIGILVTLRAVLKIPTDFSEDKNPKIMVSKNKNKVTEALEKKI